MCCLLCGACCSLFDDCRALYVNGRVHFVACYCVMCVVAVCCSLIVARLALVPCLMG